MKKVSKKDIFNISLLLIIFFIIYFILTRFTYLFGSVKDWNQQYWLIPDYFRNLFYENHDLFPDFAFNLGGGQNIYNFAYYGFLNPIILFSYLLPFVSMQNYIIISTIFLLFLSIILMYFFIKKNSNSKIAFICGFFFLMASPLIFHSHRHIMFVNYLPFLILGYYGVDKYFKDGKTWLMSLSTFLMIMTSYFFSVSGIVSIIFYGIYCYIKLNKKITLKGFICDGLKFLFPIIVGVLMGCILIVPTFYSLLNGRSSSVKVNLFKLFLPDFGINKVLYSTYSCGLSSIVILSLIDNFFRERENRFLTLALIVTILFPIFLYILNGFLYVDNKVLISFIPLFIILISKTLDNIINNKIDFKKMLLLTIFFCSICLTNYFNLIGVLLIELPVMLYCVYLVNKNGSFKYFYFMLFPVLFVSCVCFNLGDVLVKRDIISNNGHLVNKILREDNEFYRIGIYDKNLDTVNNNYNLDYYTTSVYSSSSSMAFKDFYYNRLGNEIMYRSYGQMANTNNIFYNMYVGNKYIISRNFDSFFYDRVHDEVYKNDNVLPLGYSSNKLISLDYYNSLKYPENIYAYMNYIIVSDDVKNNYDNVFEKVDLDLELINSSVDIKKLDNYIYINSLDKNKLRLKINNNLKDKVLLISFDMNFNELCKVGDPNITINGIKNKLSCLNWKYNNGNYTFKYVLSNRDLSYLDIVLSRGNFLISNINFYTIDYSDIYSIISGIDSFVVDKDKTIGDKIYGNIDVKCDGYFKLSIPYDKGFNIYVDNEKVEYEKTDIDFIGFKINSGKHDIMIEYKSPFKFVGLILSIIGFLLFLGGIYVNNNRINRRDNDA